MTKRFFHALTAAALTASTAAAFVPAFPAAADSEINIDPDTTLWYDEYAQDNLNVVLPPEDDWADGAKWDYAETRALPVGNGRLGAMVYGRTDVERLQINESTVWTGGPHNYANKLEEPITKDNIAPELSGVLEDGESLDSTAEVYDKACELVLEERISEATKLIDTYFLGDERYESAYQPFVDLMLDFGHDFSKAENYIRALNTETALANVDYDYSGVHYSRETLASYPDQVIATNIKASDSSGEPTRELSFSAYMNSEQKNYSVSQLGENELALSGTVTSSGGALINSLPNAVWFEARLWIDTDGTVAYENEKLSVTDASYATVYVTGATNYIDYKTLAGYETDEDGNVVIDSLNETKAAALPKERCDAVKTHLGGKSYEDVKAAHETDYSALYSRSAIDFTGDESENELKYAVTDERIALFDGYHDISLMQLYFNYGKYLLISSSRTTDELIPEYGENMLPKGQPANLQGIWSWETSPDWGSKYTTNINTEMNYFMAQTANLGETEQTLFDAIAEVAESGERTAKVHYGIDAPGAWVLHHNFDLWRGTAPVDGASSGMWPTGGAWLVNHLWEYYSFNQDETFLEEYYPIMKGSAEFFEGYLREYTDPEDGKTYLVSPASISPEHGDVRLSPTMDNSLIKNVLLRCAQAAEILGTDPDKITLWREMAEKIPGYETVKYGDYLREWLVDETDERIGDAEHRHPSQLWALHPGLEVSPYDNTPEEQAVFDAFVNALDRRGDGATGWSAAWRVCLWARAGYTDEAYRHFSNLIKKATAPNLFDMHPADVFQIDGNLGGAAAVIEMVMQSSEEDITFLPALPAQWRDGSFSGLKARGGHTVSASWDDGSAVSAEITAGKDGAITLRYTDGVANAVVSDGSGAPVAVTISENKDKLTFEAKKGESYTITGFTKTEYTPAPEPTPEPPATPEPIEYLNNGDMEGTDSSTNVPYWWGVCTDGDSDTVTVSNDYFGTEHSKCAIISSRISPSSGIQQYLSNTSDPNAEKPVLNGKTYNVSAWVKSEVDETVNLVIRYNYSSDDIAASAQVKAGEWTLISAPYTMRDEGTITQFIVNTETTNADLRVDNASISAPEEETEPSPTATADPDATPTPAPLNNGNMEAVDPSNNVPYWWGVRKFNDDESDAVKAAADTDAHGGSYSMLVSDRMAAGSAAEQYITLANGETYNIGAWVKCPEDDTARLVIRYGYWEDETAAEAEVKADEWTYISAPYTVRDSGNVTQLLICTKDTACDMRIDDVTITPAADIPTEEPTDAPTDTPTEEPTTAPTDTPTEEATDAPEGISVSTPVLEDGNAVVRVTNNTDAAAVITVYVAEYDANGMLSALRAETAGLEADGEAATVSLPAKAGCKVLVWDSDMKPLIPAPRRHIAIEG